MFLTIELIPFVREKIQGNNKKLKELEALHLKYIKRQEVGVISFYLFCSDH